MSDADRRSAVQPATLERLFGAWPDPLLLIDEDGVVRHANRAALVLMGREPSALELCPLASLVADSPAACDALIRQGLRSSLPTPARLELRAPQGARLSVRAEVALLEPASADGPALLWCRLVSVKRGNSQFELLNQQIEALKREVGRRQVAEGEMRQQSEWLETVLQGITEGVVATDLQGSILFMNQVAADLTGWPRVLALGRPVTDVVQWESGPEGYGGTLPEVLQGGVAARRLDPVDLLCRGGAARPVQISVSPLRAEQGGQRGTVLVLHSLEEEKRSEAQRRSLEQQLRESQKMEALGTMAGGIAHDFNNIVAAILGNVELALGDVPAGSPGVISLQEIRKAGRRARDLVQQILAFSRRQSNVRSVVDVAALLREAEAMLRSAVPPGAEFQVQVDATLPGVVANATQIEQVLLNLIGNALQALADRPGGRVTVHARACPTPVAPPEPDELEVLAGGAGLQGCALCLSVSDNGCGMDETTLSRIFEPFFTTKPVGQGTGLGLAVVHGILSEHGACLRVKSRRGEGTRFSLWLPGVVVEPADVPARAIDVGPPEVPPAAGRPARQAARILYVDDDHSIAFLVRRFLERSGYVVCTCETPDDALALLDREAGAFDLCITDYNMPGMSGLALAGEVRQRWSRLPVVIASGHISDELRTRGPGAGVAELLHKPDTVEELCRCIERVLQTVQRDR